MHGTTLYINALSNQSISVYKLTSKLIVDLLILKGYYSNGNDTIYNFCVLSVLGHPYKFKLYIHLPEPVANCHH